MLDRLASRARTRLACLTVATALTAGIGGALAAPAQADTVADLINQIAHSDQQLSDLDGNLSAQRETANRALVDLQTARDSEDLSKLAVSGASDSLRQADVAVQRAQEAFNKLTRTLYMRGNVGNLSQLLTADNPQQVLDSAAVADQLTRDQKLTVTNLIKARNEKSNKLASATASKKQATVARQSAERRHDAAVQSIAAAQRELESVKTQRTQLVQLRDAAQVKLNQLRGVPTTSAPGAPAQPSTATPGIAAPETITQPNSDGVVNAPSAPVNPQQLSSIAGVPLPPLPSGPIVDAGLAALTAIGNLAKDVAQKVIAQAVALLQRPHTDLNPSPAPGGTTPQPGLRGPAAVEVVVNRALSQLGVPYAWGGGDANGPTKGIRDGGVADSYGDYNKIGFDCSGLMIYAFAGIGYSLPHYTGYQYESGPQVPISQMQRGDMIFWGPNHHVALYLGNNQMVEAPESGEVVKISQVRGGAVPYVVRLW